MPEKPAKKAPSKPAKKARPSKPAKKARPGKPAPKAMPRRKEDWVICKFQENKHCIYTYETVYYRMDVLRVNFPVTKNCPFLRTPPMRS